MNALNAAMTAIVGALEEIYSAIPDDEDVSMWLSDEEYAATTALEAARMAIIDMRRAAEQEGVK